MKYIKYFNEHNVYTSYIADSSFLPNLSYCEDLDHLHLNKSQDSDPFNGYEYVDLGLPSGTLWATKNIYATNLYNSGWCFSWGDIVGADPFALVIEEFSWSTYILGNGGSTASDMTKYNSTDNKTILDLEDDAAHVIMGGSWHIPTVAQMQEIENDEYVSFSYEEDNNKKYVRLTSLINGNELIIPISTFIDENTRSTTGEIYLWSNQLYNNNKTSAQMLYADIGGVNAGFPSARYMGLNIRGVVG